MIFIAGNTPSSKNSKQFVTLKNGKKLLLNSKIVRKYIDKSEMDWRFNKTEFFKMLKGKNKPYKIELYFIRDSKRKFDYINAAQIIFDLMQHYGYIEDDDSQNIIPVFKGYKVDKLNAGVEINVI
nr:MAG TPA: crossover junction endodeoxyribonuclease [Caudoviricetes sp.]